MRADYLFPARGEWVTFHPTSRGYAEVGQVAAVLDANQWGRVRYRIQFWAERTKSKNTMPVRVDDTISADRLIAITTQPRGMKSPLAP